MTLTELIAELVEIADQNPDLPIAVVTLGGTPIRQVRYKAIHAGGQHIVTLS